MNFTVYWYQYNFTLLRAVYYWSAIKYDAQELKWIRIDRFPLPKHFLQRETRLLMLLPGINQPVSLPPKFFYLNRGLTTKWGTTPAHVFNNTAYHGAPDYSHLHYAFYCLMLDDWRPTKDVVSGDNLVTALNAVKARLERA